MRIVQVSVGSVRIPPGEGSAPLQVIFSTSRNLAKMGHDVAILDRRYSRDDPSVETVEGVKIVRLKAARIPCAKAPGLMRFILAELNAALFTVAVSRYLRKNSPDIDVIHVHLTSTGLVVAMLDGNLRSRMFYTCHLGEWQMARERLGIVERLHLLLDQRLMRRVRKVIALNEAAREAFIASAGVKAEHVAVVHNGVDTEFFTPRTGTRENARKQYGMEGRPTVLFVGRLARIKGIDQLLRAADIVVNGSGRKDALFLLVGPAAFDATERPIDMEETRDFLRQHRLDGNVIFTGSLPPQEVGRLYAASDIFVLPSLAEGDPLVTVEAMASGKPLIGTKVGGIPHQIRDGWNGFLVEPGNALQLAEKIKYLIENPEERERMGANSRRYAEEEFDWRKVAEKLFAVYQS